MYCTDKNLGFDGTITYFNLSALVYSAIKFESIFITFSIVIRSRTGQTVKFYSNPTIKYVSILIHMT